MIQTSDNWVFAATQIRKEAQRVAKKYKEAHKGMKQVIARRENRAIYLKWEKA